jgi:hypothetical protein
MRQSLYLLAAAFLWTSPLFAQTGPVVSKPPTPQGPPNQPIQEKLVSFDPRTAEIRWIDNRWQLLAGGVWLKDFGRRQWDAEQALRLIRELGLNQHGTVGTPQTIMEYWLVNGQAPRGLALGQRLSPLDLNSLRVEQIQGQWCVRDARRLYFVFGPHADEARTALEIIRRHGFTQIGSIGHPVPAMIYFLGGPDDSSRARLEPPASLVSRRHDLPRHDPAASVQQVASTQPGPQHSGLIKASTNPLLLQNSRQLAAINPLAFDQPGLGERVAFDPRQLRLRREGQEWKLYSSDYLIANFGPHYSDAQRGLNALQFYRCNEHCLVGQPTPRFSFFLANGQAPRGLMFGMSGVAFRPKELTIRQVGSDWTICDAHRALISAGNQVDEAKKLLRIIQQQKFDKICHIGPVDPRGLTLLVRTR